MFSLRKRRSSARGARDAHTPSLRPPPPSLAPPPRDGAVLVPLTSSEECVGAVCTPRHRKAQTTRTSSMVGDGADATLTHGPPPLHFKLAPLRVLPPPAFVYATASSREHTTDARTRQLAAAIAAATAAGKPPTAQPPASSLSSSSRPHAARATSSQRASVGARELIDAVFAATTRCGATAATPCSSFVQSPLSALVGLTSIDRDTDNPRNIGLPLPLPSEPANATTGMRNVYLGRQLPPVMVVAERRHRCIAIALHPSAVPASRQRVVAAAAAAMSARAVTRPSSGDVTSGTHAHTAGKQSGAAGGGGNDSSTTTSHSNGISDSADVAPPPLLPPPLLPSSALPGGGGTADGGGDDGEHLYFGTVLGYTYDDTALVWHNRAQRFASRVPVTSIARVYRVVVALCLHCGLVFLRAELAAHMQTHLKGSGVAADVAMGDDVLGIACGDTALLRALVYDRPLGEGAQGVVDLYTVGPTTANAAAAAVTATTSSQTTATATRTATAPRPSPLSLATPPSPRRAPPPLAPSCRVRQHAQLLAAHSARAGSSSSSSGDHVATTAAATTSTRAAALGAKPRSTSPSTQQQQQQQQQQQHRDTTLVSLVSDTDGGMATSSSGSDAAAAATAVVVKTMRFDSSTVARECYHRAVRFMTSTSHPCLVEYLAVQMLPDQRTVRLVMPYYREGDLTNFIRGYRGDRLSEAFVCTMALQLAQALSCLHTRSPPIVHGDVKMDNVMLCDGARRVVLMDLDASCEMRDNHSTVPTLAGTTAYMAPEALRRARVMPASDMWSLGVLLYVLVMLPEFPMIIDPDTMQPTLLNADAWASDADVQLLQSLSSGSYEADKTAATGDGRATTASPSVSLSSRAQRRVCSVPLDDCVRINVGRRCYSRGLTQLIVELLRFNPLRRPSAAAVEQRLRALLVSAQ